MPPPFIGAHMSIANGLHNALYSSKKIGANTLQIFTANQRSWRTKKLNPKEIKLWEKAREETQMSHIMSHDSYLINLGSPKKETHEKSKKAFIDEIKRCSELKIDYLNFHPGAALTQSEEECLERIAKTLLSFEKLLNKKPLLTLETTAGQGSCVGYSFEHLGYIIKRVRNKIPIGVCFDTCHSFASGYDIRTSKSFLKVLREFDEIVGLKYLKAFHLNDSKKELGSRRDRHEHLGKGKIGLECFKFLMQNPKTSKLPKYLETPLGDKYWTDEIKLLKKFATKRR